MLKKQSAILPALLAVGALSSAPAFAADPEGWSGDAAFGLLNSSGNTDSRSMNGKLDLEYASLPWRNTFGATAINTSDSSGDTSAEQYTATNQLDYVITDTHYLFGALDFSKDMFGATRERFSETVGYGNRLLDTPVNRLDVQAGIGARQSQEQDTRDRYDEFIGTAAIKYRWTISKTSTFNQSLSVEAGSENTYTESISELKLAVVGNLYAGLSFTVQNNSRVTEDTKHTDTYTAVNLSYSFGKTTP